MPLAQSSFRTAWVCRAPCPCVLGSADFDRLQCSLYLSVLFLWLVWSGWHFFCVSQLPNWSVSVFIRIRRAHQARKAKARLDEVPVAVSGARPSILPCMYMCSIWIHLTKTANGRWICLQTMASACIAPFASRVSHRIVILYRLNRSCLFNVTCRHEGRCKYLSQSVIGEALHDRKGHVRLVSLVRVVL